MSEPFVGQLALFGFNYAPPGWALCNGQLLPIPQNAALFSLLGTAFGGNGTTNFGLPNLQGRLPVGLGQQQGGTQSLMGDTGGTPTVTLSSTQMPAHTHGVFAMAVQATAAAPAAAVVAQAVVPSRGGSSPVNFYATTGVPAPLTQAMLVSNGLDGPHNNQQPSLVLNWCIALTGIYPPRP